MKEKLGFLHILRVISVSKTPLVFHAGELDLYLTMKHFFCEELPETLEEFKSITTATFPQIFDTLLMSRNEPLKSNFPEGNSLGEIFKKVQDQVRIVNLACVQETDWKQVFLLLSSKSKQVSSNRCFSGPCFRQEGGTGFRDRKNNLMQVFRQDRVPWQDPVLLENLSQNLFPVFYSCSAFLSWTRPENSMS